jgi:hypothetical protein
MNSLRRSSSVFSETIGGRMQSGSPGTYSAFAKDPIAPSRSLLSIAALPVRNSARAACCDIASPDNSPKLIAASAG